MQLSAHTVETILKWASTFPTVEVTGLVSHGNDPGEERVVVMQNISSTPETDYAWHPQEMVHQYQEMDKRGHKPLAFYHSHPNGRSDPSEIDMKAAMQVGMVYLVAYPVTANTKDYGAVRHVVDGGGWRLSAWLCMEPGILIAEPLDIL
jgi:desampylase